MSEHPGYDAEAEVKRLRGLLERWLAMYPTNVSPGAETRAALASAAADPVEGMTKLGTNS